jgi:hypothetical protein
MRRVAITALLVLATAPAAEARGVLTKRGARTEALRFITPFVGMLDETEDPRPRMEPPRRCTRVSHVTVRCEFTTKLRTGRTLHDHVTVHRQRDGLLGFRDTLDVFADEID